MAIKHIFFDLDRTLWDFDKNSDDTLHELFRDYKLSERLKTDASQFIEHYKMINEALWGQYREGKITKENLRTERYAQTFASYGVVDEALSLSFGNAYIKRCPLKTTLFPGTIELLEELTVKKYGLHIISNGFREVQPIKMKASGLTPFFEVVMTSERAECKKPGTDIFLKAMAEAGAQAHESIMIGDHYEVDVLGAENVGMKAVLFDPNGIYAKVSHRKINQLRDLIPFLT